MIGTTTKGSAKMNYDIRDLSFAERGRQRIAWAARNMPVLRQIQAEFANQRPFQNRPIPGCLDITTETAVLLHTLRAGGAEIALCASNPLSTKDEVCAALVADGISVYARYAEALPTYQRHIEQTLAIDPHLVMDDGADRIVALPSGAAGKAGVRGMAETPPDQAPPRAHSTY